MNFRHVLVLTPRRSLKCAVAGADNYQTGDGRGQEISIKKPFILSGSEYQPRVSRVYKHRASTSHKHIGTSQSACHYSGVKDLTIRTLEQTKASLDNPALLFSCLESSDSIIVLLQRKK